jgi:hypothetical protein
MTGEADEAMRYRGVPHPNALVVPSAHHTPTIVPNRQRAYGMGMAAYLDRWSAYRSGIPHEHPPIVSAGNHPPVRQHSDRQDHAVVPAEPDGDIVSACCGGIPHEDPPVVSAGNHPPVRQNRDRPHRAAVAAYFEWSSARCGGIPHEDPPIVSAGNHPPVRQNRDRPHHIAMAAEVYRGLGRSRIPQTNTTIATAGDHPPVGQQC